MRIACSFVIFCLCAEFSVIRPSIADNLVTVPSLSGNYTLTYTFNLKKVPDELKTEGADFSVPGKVEVSSNGTRFLWSIEFGKWCRVIIYDETTSIYYYYEKQGASVNGASIRRGLGEAYARMYLPFPGGGLSCFPFVKSVSCGNGYQQCSGAAAMLNATSVQGGGPLFDPDSVLVFKKWGAYNVISHCTCLAPPRPGVPSGDTLESWKFGKYEMFGSTPIAGQIDFRLNRGKWVGSQIVMSTRLIASCTLLSTSLASLPDEDFKLETYLTPGVSTITDNTTNRGAGFVYDPKVGSLDDQRVASFANEDHIAVQKASGQGPDRTKTGVFVLIALILFGTAAWITVRRRAG